MKLIQKLTALVAGLTLTASPVLAKVDRGTTSLLQSLPQYGIKIALNSDECNGRYHGSYHTGTKVLTVCYHGTPTANDHDTVRHEAFHALQHCAALKSGQTYGLRPILRGDQLNTFVTTALTNSEIVEIKSNYPKEKWLTELEAFAAAKIYTANQIYGLITQWC